MHGDRFACALQGDEQAEQAGSEGAAAGGGEEDEVDPAELAAKMARIQVGTSGAAH